ncbi:MAG: hypothetical protein AAFR93_13905, partial [Pseudomonadota bacterium]
MGEMRDEAAVRNVFAKVSFAWGNLHPCQTLPMSFTKAPAWWMLPTGCFDCGNWSIGLTVADVGRTFAGP